MLSKFLFFLQGKKTYLICASAIITALIAYANGQLGIVGLIQAIFAALGAASLRAGIAKGASK